MKNIITLFALLFFAVSYAQVPSVSGIDFREITTTQMNAISSPDEGLTIYNTTTKSIWSYNGTIWVEQVGGGGGGTDDQDLDLTGTALSIEDGNTVNFTGWDTDSSNDVTLTGAQTIPGNKTFTGTNTEFRSTTGTGPTFYSIDGTRYMRSVFSGSNSWSLDPNGSGDAILYNFTLNRWIIPENSDVFLDASGFDGNLTTSDNTLQEVAQKLDDFSGGGGGTDDQTATEVPFTPNGSIAATNVQAAIQEVRDEAGSSDVKLETSALADGYTVVATDGDSGKTTKVYNGVDDILISMSDVFEIGEKMIFRQANSGKIQVDMNGNGINWQTINNSGSVTIWKYSGGYLLDGNYEVYTPPVPVATQLYTTANALAIDDEANSQTGVSETGGGAISTITGSSDTGTYFLRLTGDDGDRLNVNVSGLTIGETYTIAIATKTNISALFNVWTGFEAEGGGVADPQDGGSPQVFSNTTWQTYTWDLDATATSGIIRAFLTGTGTLDIDSLSITVKE